MDDYPLLVPVTLEGLVLGKENAPLADVTYNYEQLQYFPFGKSASNGYFTEKQELPGIHLHWTMPDALLKGVVNKKKELEFRALPNRWMVMRLWQQDGSLKRRAWIVESDYITNTSAKTMHGMYKTTVPTLRFSNGLWTGAGPDEECFGYLGDVREYGKERREEGRYLDKLTAVGFGDTMFAASYPSCRTVFGFYDSMDGMEHNTFTYMIAGWYSDERKDPLADASAETLSGLGWKLCEEGKIPGNTLCHAVLKDIRWDGKEGAYKTAMPAGNVELYIGNTSAEALSAMIQEKTPDIKGMERMMNALLINALRDLDDTGNPDALIEFEERLLADQFAAEEGGYQWQVRKCDGKKEAGTLSEAEIKELDRLSELQEEINENKNLLSGLREEIYSAWYKYVMIRKDPFASSSSAQSFARLITNLSEELFKNVRVVEEAGRMAEDLSEHLSASLKDKNLSVERVNSPRYYISAAPVLMMSGEGVKRGYKQGFQVNADGLLPCRTEIIKEFTVNVEDQTVVITPEDIKIMFEPLQKAAETPIEDLAAESVLLTQGFARVIGKAAIEKAGKLCSPPLLQKVAGEIREQQAAQTGYSGFLPFQCANAAWEQPWTPFMMEWDVKIMPSRRTIGRDDSFAAFVLEDMELEPKGALPVEKERELEIQGRTLITPHAVTNMYHRLMQLIEDYGAEGKHYEELKKAAETVKTADILSQRIDGFQEVLLMKDNVPFVPAFSPFSDADDIVRKVTGEGAEYMLTPRVLQSCDSFLPVRAGLLHISQLNIVDSFGQVRKIHIDRKIIHTAESMRYESPDYEAVMRPRFLQPGRIDWKWISYKDETRQSMTRETSPVFGYIIPNFLDKSLQIYEENGRLLGFIQQGRGETKWFRAPGQQAEPSEIKVKHLRYFVTGLLGKNNRAGELLDCLDASFQSVETSGPENFLQYCFGNILVLARASLDVAGKGRVRLAQSWDIREENHQYDRESFEVQVGDSRKVRDGLMGYFAGNEQERTYERFHACIRGVTGTYVTCQNRFDTTLSNPAVRLTLLFDPLGSITVKTGFLPDKSVTLPPEYVDIDTMQMMFRTAPVLSGPDTLTAPVPGRMKDAWQFQSVGRSGQRELNKVEEPSDFLPEERLLAREGFLAATGKGGEK